MLVLFVVCLVHAAKRGRSSLAYVLGGFAFGLMLEYIEVLSGSYNYGRFYLMLGRAPLAIPICIGAGWAIIMYTARLFSDALRLPLLSAAALDTLLALNIDLSMDVVAYRMHMWHWSWVGTGLNPMTAEWFGIPYGNFVGWATVIFCYSAFSRTYEKVLIPTADNSVLRITAVALLALLCSQAVLFSAESFLYPFLRTRFGVTSLQRIITVTCILFALLFAGWRRRSKPAHTMAAVTLWVPGWFHVFFIFCFFTLGFYRENAAMTALACTNVTIGLVIHLYPWWHRPRSGDSCQVDGAIEPAGTGSGAGRRGSPRSMTFGA